LSEEEKRHARRSLLNVCDQLYYILAINKSTDFLTPNELSTLYEQAKTFEPANIAALRQRDAVQTNRTSLITSIRKPLIENISNVSSEIKSLQFNVQDALRLTRKDIESIALDIKQQQEKIGQQGLIIDRQREKIEQQGVVIDRQRENIEELTRTTKQQLDSMKSIAVVTLDITKKQEKTRKFFWKKTDYFLSIQSGHTEFIDALIFRCSMFKPGSILALSRIVPFDTYLEYNLSGSGSQIYFFLFATIGSRLFVEVVVDGIICKQEVFSVIREGPQSVSVQNIGNGAIVRFKTLDNSSIVRVLEVWNRKMRIFARKSLAAYIS
jgi:hypothetical protein